jgi:hypothetical protein
MDIQSSTPAPTAVATAVAASSVSAISWGAIIAGAVVASAISLLLFVLAAGLDLASFSRPLLRHGSAAGLTVMAAITLIASQWIASGVGGYITGRLRTRWTSTHTHEVFFRDTAHGFITWAVVTLFMALGLGSAASAVFGSDYQPTRGALAASTPQASNAERVGTATVLVVQSGEAQASRDLTEDTGGLQLALPPEGNFDGRMVLAQDLADAPRDDRLVTPDTARKDAAVGSLLVALSMLVGAFIASVSAAIGGRLRDLHP